MHLVRKRKPALASTKIKRAPGTKRSYIPEAPIVRIVEAHKLNIAESTAALDILVTSRRTFGLPALEIDSDTRPPIDFDAADDRAAKGTDLTRAYSTWRADLRDTIALRVADAVLLKETPLGAIDEANHWRRGTALDHLMVALRHFAVLRGNAPRGMAREWKYSATKC